MRLDLELHLPVRRDQRHQLVDQHRLCRGGEPVAVTQVCGRDHSGSALVRPSRQGRAQREQGIVKYDQLIVCGEADVGLEGRDATGERRLKRGYRGVRPVGPTEPVRDQKRRRDTRMGAGKTRLVVNVSSPGRDQDVTTRASICR